MSALGNLQERLASALGSGVRQSGTPMVEVPPLGLDRLADLDLAVNESAPTQTAPQTTPSLQALWLGGGGVVGGVGLLAVGYAGGVFALAGVLAMAAAAVTIAMQLRKTGLAPRSAESEHEYDRRWEEDERAVILSAIHDQLGDLAVTRDLDRRILRANRVFRNLTTRLHPEGLTCEQIGIEFRGGREANCYDATLTGPSGRRVFVWHDVVMRDRASGALVIESIARDVTEEREAADVREEARLRAEYSSAAKSRLLATVSHEIRTPLSGILGMSQLLGQTKVTAEQGNYLAGIRQSGNALIQLVEDLLDFSTIEVGRFQLRPRSEPLRPLMESVVEMLSHRAHDKGIEVATTVSGDVPELLNFDPARLRQVLFNVIGNAVKFTHDGGVLVRAVLDGADLLITVKDSGPGMTSEEQVRIFGEFEQAGSAVEKSGGTGLGLPISARILREFGGSLTVASEKGKGSEFRIRFPLSVPLDQRAASRRGMLEGARVLLLAPDGPASTAITETIKTLGGHCLHLEPSNVDGFSIGALGAGHRPPTDIIVDHRMAPYFFREFSDRIQIAAPGIRKIFLVNPEERAVRPLELFDAWLIRPLREQSLIDVLRGRMEGMERRDARTEARRTLSVTPPVDTPPPSGLRILLGEDDPINAMLIRATLARAGHDVRLVEDFDSLLRHCLPDEGARPDLVVTDLSMPGGEGLDVLLDVRAQERRAGLYPLPVIVLTADHRDETRSRALVNGANAVYVKPIEPTRLLSEVANLAGGGSSVAATG